MSQANKPQRKAPREGMPPHFMPGDDLLLDMPTSIMSEGEMPQIPEDNVPNMPDPLAKFRDNNDPAPLYVHRLNKAEPWGRIVVKGEFKADLQARPHLWNDSPLCERVSGPQAIDPFFRCQQAIAYLDAQEIVKETWPLLRQIEFGPRRLEVMAYLSDVEGDGTWPEAWDTEGGFESWFRYNAGRWLNNLPEDIQFEAEWRQYMAEDGPNKTDAELLERFPLVMEFMTKPPAEQQMSDSVSESKEDVTMEDISVEEATKARGDDWSAF
ncbi:hypothetical protein ACJ41O_006620 [Fusarium nematophilum]